ncbi:TonB-dependent receptor [Caulobacter sp. KR2-114]|uniref:TonB-dependent receptor n=1 Tax=Caulobacter sp. KR2-114 TaxID=3400912 RepID=UPI003C0102FF
MARDVVIEGEARAGGVTAGPHAGRWRARLLAGGALTLLATTALAQSAPADPKPGAAAATSHRSAAEADEAADRADAVAGVTVTAQRERPQYGAVVGDIKPELQMSPADIQSYGVSTVTELLDELSPETRSDRGRGASAPVVLLNGHRISSLGEVQNIPTEAILRIDILPEEVSLKYGYSADQRVVNIVLKRRFRAVTGEVAGGGTTEGGDATGQVEIDQFQVRRDTRFNLDLKYQAAGGLTDAERGLTEPAAGAPYDLAGNVVSPTGGEIDPALSALAGRPVTVAGVPAVAGAGRPLTLSDFAPTAGVANVTDTAADHSLVPATHQLTANVVAARPIFWGINATANVTLGATHSDSLQGLPGVSLLVPAGDPFSPFAGPVAVDRYVAGQAPLRQTSDGWTAHVGFGFNRDVGDWRLTLTTAYNHADTVTHTGQGLDAAGLQALLNAGSTTLDPFGPLPAEQLASRPLNLARAVTDGGNIQILAAGPLLKLPAGNLYVSAKFGDVASAASSSVWDDTQVRAQSLARNDVQALLNIDLPIASRSRRVLGFLGDLSLNSNAAVDRYSDFGALTTLGFGLNWTPIKGYNLIVSETRDHLAPTLAQLDGPVLETPGVRIFDYVTGQTVSVTQVTGGEASLKADSRRVIKVGLTIRPIASRDLTFTANYVDSHIDGAIGAFPAATAGLEAAFPARFVRDANGVLVEEDLRPLNFASQDRQELRWGVNFSMPVGKQPRRPPFDRRAFLRGRGRGEGGRRPEADGDFEPPPGPPPDGMPPPPGADGGGRGEPGSGRGQGGGGSGGGPDGPGGGGPGGGGPGGGFGGPGGFGGGGFGGGGFGGRGFGGGRRGFGGGPPVGGRFQVAVYHTIIFKDRYQVAAGGPALDLLNGAPAGGSGGQYRHEVEAQLGYTNQGYGLRLSADWRSATTVAGGAMGQTGTLNFSDIGTLNLRLWDDFSSQPKMLIKHPFLRGVRLTLNVSNLFDQRIKVTSTAGPTPLIYQSAFLNPTGRVVSLSLRKILY